MRGRRGALIAAALAVAGATALPGGIARGQDPGYRCQAGAVVIVAGTNDVNAPSQIGVKQRYTGLHPNGAPNPNSDYFGDDAYRVVTPGYPTTLWPIGAVGYDDDVARGTLATVQAIVEYQANCPGRNVVVVGYSQGARVAGDVLNQVGTATETEVRDGIVYKKVVGSDGQTYLISAEKMTGELYSDPRRDGPESGRGIELALAGVIPGLTMSGPRPGGFGAIPVTSYCYEGDPICDLPDLLHDPVGAIDGFVGYFTKHGFYVWRMWAPVADAHQWHCAESPAAAGVGYVDCVVPAPSAISEVRRDLTNRARALVGLGPREVIDVVGMLPNLNGVFPHADFADLQKYLTPVMALVPPLPELGYGAYLPDLLLWSGLLDGVSRADLDAVSGNLAALAASGRSIALLPVNFVKYWGTQAVAGFDPAPTARRAAGPSGRGGADAERQTPIVPAGLGTAGPASAPTNKRAESPLVVVPEGPAPAVAEPKSSPGPDAPGLNAHGPDELGSGERGPGGPGAHLPETAADEPAARRPEPELEAAIG